ncbi:type IV toxin-antitoxin system AbiEi family antitoxin domain-containing protein [Pseudomonas sp. CAU 1711]|uniref:type IV toxin-antitoxin system AbiEi family antitoxin n=1 Tax=Pseudomonas sp. CAU 1711 TaxID=3140356 RepID=UPI003260AAA1
MGPVREHLQPIRRLYAGLDDLASPERYLFTPSDIRTLVPDISAEAYRALLSRAARDGRLERVCRGLYFYRPARANTGSLLFHAAARLRAQEFNYISLETVLSDAGVISQVPLNWITLMSSGRSSRIACGRWGTIEFVHTRQKPQDLLDQLDYDRRCRLWRARPAQAMRDMRVAKRNLDLIDWSAANELV